MTSKPSLLTILSERGCIHDASHLQELDAKLEREPITFYCGFDPTADSLHVGSMLPLILMRRLQSRGHRPLILLGSATGMIGDPSGKSEERKLLDADSLTKNTQAIERQAKLFLSDKGENAYQIVRNHEWLNPISMIDFLRSVGKHFTVNSMIAKESVKARMENREQGISYTEFSYMLLQAYDFYWLYKNKNCRLQVGGSDQWGNITAGLELIRRKSEASALPAYGMTFPLLVTSTGSKFGKTERGTVWLDPQKTAPYHFYQYWMNTTDADIIKYIKIFTEADEEQLAELQLSVEKNPDQRLAQSFLAEELTTLVHGKDETVKAIRASKLLFGETLTDIDSRTLLEVFSDVPATELPSQTIKDGILITDLLAQCQLAQSKGAARRLIEGGGIYINNEKITDPLLTVDISRFVDELVLVLRSGKKNYHLLKIQSS